MMFLPKCTKMMFIKVMDFQTTHALVVVAMVALRSQQNSRQHLIFPTK
jgi:hypothetical protein